MAAETTLPADSETHDAAALLSRLKAPVEAAVSGSLGRPWSVRQMSDLCDLASHPAAIYSDGAYAVFAKHSDAANCREQFEVELAGLSYLSSHAGISTPQPIAIIQIAGGCVLILEAVQPVERTRDSWRQIGHTLARIHACKGARFGFDRDGYFGALPQSNGWMDDWAVFFGERRLWAAAQLGLKTGNLPLEMARKVEKLMGRLPELCGPPVMPALLHGDAQHNNFISNRSGAVVVDPAVYYGHPEMDLAHLDYFQPAPPDVFDAYDEVMPIDPGFPERRELWRLWAHLAVVAVAGPTYLARLEGALAHYR